MCSNNLCDVTTVQISYGTIGKFSQNFTFHENTSPLYTFIVRCVRAKITVLAFRIQPDQSKKNDKSGTFMFKVNGELFFCCGFTDSVRVTV